MDGLTKLTLTMGKVIHSVWLPLTGNVVRFLTLTRSGNVTVAEAVDKMTMDGEEKTRVLQEISSFFEAAQATDMFLLKKEGLVRLEASTADQPLFNLAMPRPKLRNPRHGITVDDVINPKR